MNRIQPINTLARFIYILFVLIGVFVWLAGLAVVLSVFIGTGDRHEGFVVVAVLLITNAIAIVFFALGLLFRYLARNRLPNTQLYSYRFVVFSLVVSLIVFALLWLWVYLA